MHVLRSLRFHSKEWRPLALELFGVVECCDIYASRDEIPAHRRRGGSECRNRAQPGPCSTLMSSSRIRLLASASQASASALVLKPVIRRPRSKAGSPQ